MTDRELLQQALDALLNYQQTEGKVIEAIRTRLAQPEPKPVAWEVWTIHNHIFFSIGVQSFQINDVLEHEPEVSAEEFSEWIATQLRHALTQLSNTAPPKKEWVGLTDDDVNRFVDAIYKGLDMKPTNEIEIQYFERLIKFIDRKLKEKNSD